MDAFSTPLLKYLRALPNSVVNHVFEASPSDMPRPTPQTARQDRHVYLTAKYVARQFILPFDGTPEDLQAAFSEAILRDDVARCLELIVQGASIDVPLMVNGSEVEPMQAVIERRLSAMAIMLLLWGRDVNAPFEDGRNPLLLAVTTQVRCCVDV